MVGEKKPKGKRIAAEDYWILQELSKKLNKAQRKYQKWLRKRARSENCYIDQLENTLTGKIQLDPTKECPQGEVRRASKDFIAEVEGRFETLQILVDEYNDKYDDIAKEYGTPKDLLDPKTGIIGADENGIAEKIGEKSIIEPIEEDVTGKPETGNPESAEVEEEKKD